MTAITDRDQLATIAAKAADNRLNVEFETEGMTLNIGPQHPATHGTLRIVAKLDGEQVVSCEPIAGYMHRGYEKLTEVRTYPQVTTLINRIDWLGSFANEVPFILAAEKLMDVEAPPRAQYIRTILFELSRLANIILFLGDLGIQLGGLSIGFYSFRDREFVLNQIEASPAVASTPTSTASAASRTTCPRAGSPRPTWPWRRCGRSATRSRTCSSATRSSRSAPAASASSRRTSPSPTACRAPTPAAAASTGTSAATTARPASSTTRSTGRSGPTPTATRSPARGCACRRSASPPRSSTSCSTASRAARSWPRCPRIIKVPEGEAWVATENPLGEMGYYVVSKGDLVPFRVKIRSASFNNVSIVPWVCRGVYVPDVITILASLYFILGDIDR